MYRCSRRFLSLAAELRTDQSTSGPLLWRAGHLSESQTCPYNSSHQRRCGEADGRQQERALPDHRRAARRRRRVEFQSLSGEETAGGIADQCRARRPEDPEQVMRTALALAALALFALADGARAEIVSREQDIVDLRLGQRVMVDDGSCPAGQIKEVQGSQMTTTGVVGTRKCVPRLGAKTRW